MPKLLIVTTIPVTMSAFLLPFIKWFRERGWRVDGMSSGISDCDILRSSLDAVWDVEWSRKPLETRFVKSVRQARAAVSAVGYDIVHVHTPVAAFITRYALRRTPPSLPRPIIIYTAHGFHFHPRGSWLSNGVFSRLERLAGRWTDYLVVINSDDEKRAREYRLVSPERVIYIPGIGVDTRRLRPESVDPSRVLALRSELGLADGERLFSVVANYDPGKRQADVIRALASVRVSNVHLALAGLGTVPREWYRIAAKLGITDRVHCLGYRSDVPVLMRASVATILASEREGLSRSVLESMSLGIPVIGAAVRGIRELLEGGGGLLFEVGDTGGLAWAMERVLFDSAQAEAMGRAGRAYVSRFDVAKIIAEHEQLYAKALADCGRPLVKVGAG